MEVVLAPGPVDVEPDLTAAEWIFLGCELHGTLRWLHRRRMVDAAAAELRQIGWYVVKSASPLTTWLPPAKTIRPHAAFSPSIADASAGSGVALAGAAGQRLHGVFDARFLGS